MDRWCNGPPDHGLWYTDGPHITRQVTPIDMLQCNGSRHKTFRTSHLNYQNVISVTGLSFDCQEYLAPINGAGHEPIHDEY